MTSDFSTAAATPQGMPDQISQDIGASQIRFKAEAGQLLLFLPTTTTVDIDWQVLLQHLQQRLSAGNRFWQPHTPVHLISGDRLLDARQLQLIADTLAEAQLPLQWVHTSRRQTAVAAATAGYCLEQSTPQLPLRSATPTGSALADPLYLQTPVRSGIEIRHPGTVVVLGDLNPGGAILADGDILIWGRLRGVAHAGASGNLQCRIMALRMEPTQLRIADQVARAPEHPPAQFYPELAQVVSGGIQIIRASHFSRDLSLPLPKLSESS